MSEVITGETAMDQAVIGTAAAEMAPTSEVVLETCDVNVHYGSNHALHDTSLAFHKGEITALIGPSGCGKSTFLRSLNLMNREIRGCRVEGEIFYDGRNINTREENLYELRRSIGMVFQQPNPFHKTIYENIVFAPKRHGLRGRENLDALVEESLRGAALWDEVKDKLHQSAFSLSGGQQQRLCIARTLAMHPDVILFDEPCSALDPISTLAIEELMQSVVKDRAIVIVTHNMEQASRVSHRPAPDRRPPPPAPLRGGPINPFARGGGTIPSGVVRLRHHKNALRKYAPASSCVHVIPPIDDLAIASAHPRRPLSGWTVKMDGCEYEKRGAGEHGHFAGLR